MKKAKEGMPKLLPAIRNRKNCNSVMLKAAFTHFRPPSCCIFDRSFGA